MNSVQSSGTQPVRNSKKDTISEMSDVEQGGATVFPYHSIMVKPKKGTAVFWYNLFKDGQMDSTTLHAACPVLVGTKWVANSWNHEILQEFHRPCGLEKDSFSDEELDEIFSKLP